MSHPSARNLPKRPSERFGMSEASLDSDGKGVDMKALRRIQNSMTANEKDINRMLKKSQSNMLEPNDHGTHDDSASIGGSESIGSTVFEENPKLSAAQMERKNLGRIETRWVQILRLCTLLVLALTAVFVAMTVYTFGSKSQQASFSNEFEAHAIRVIDSFHTGITRQLAAFDTLSAGITAYAIESGSTFPNVTVPHWAIIANNFQVQAQATFVQYYPFIDGNETDDWDRTLWQKYSSLNNDWMMPSFLNEHLMRTAQDKHFGFDVVSLTDNSEAEDDNELNLGHLAHAGRFSSYIWSTVQNGPSLPFSGPYLPAWHYAPSIPLPELQNMNGIELAFYTGPATVTAKTGKASLGIMSPFEDSSDELSKIVKLFNATLFLGPYRHSGGEFQQDPVTFFGYPVFDSFVPIGTDRKVTGVLMSGLYWRVLFKDLLPLSAQGITVVLKNSLGQAETYRIDGGDAFYVGQGDLHDPSFDDMVESASIVDYLKSRASPLTQSYTATELTNEYAEYQMFVYPSSSTESVYVNREPVWYAVVIGSVFIFVTAIFLLYNYLVERRQKLVLDRAVQSTAVVQSLFPENVQKRLYEEQEQIEQNQNKISKKDATWAATETSTNGATIATFLDNNGGNVQTMDHNSTAPIADLFSASTVFFADLAGFTRWSSSRSPVEVFGLLETIYSKFDTLALRRGVFKVETIGDCYVAVTGVPEAQKDHALIMAKFSAECMVALQQLLVGSLTDKYGGDTRTLSLRIGLHSGPVTAGVLRGVKARFQLFGDTVNTAARMESTGMPGRIHCSQATADLLVTAGKGDWISPREGVVHAKGKGEMQTYWIVSSQTTRTIKSTPQV